MLTNVNSGNPIPLQLEISQARSVAAQRRIKTYRKLITDGLRAPRVDRDTHCIKPFKHQPTKKRYEEVSLSSTT